MDYSKGLGITGLDDEGNVAKTELTFMVASVGGKYKDVVVSVAVHKISADIILPVFHNVGLFFTM